MHTISDVTFGFLNDQYECFVQEFLDDPAGMSNDPDTGIDIPEIVVIYNRLQRVGIDLKRSFWAVALMEATDYEITRLVLFLKKGGVDDIPDGIENPISSPGYERRPKL